jgi:hypothetical protein
MIIDQPGLGYERQCIYATDVLSQATASYMVTAAGANTKIIGRQAFKAEALIGYHILQMFLRT